MKLEQTECSETLAYKIQMPGNYPQVNIQHQYYLKRRLSVQNKRELVQYGDIVIV